MKKNSGSVYLEVQRCIKAINKRYKIEKHVEICLLNAIYEAYIGDIDIRVLDLLLLENIASQATLHTGIKNLVKNGLVSLHTDPSDGRSKHVLPTKLALKRLDECEIAIEKCRR